MSAFITGAAGTGKTALLLTRAKECAAEGAVLITSPSWASLRVLASEAAGTNATVCALHELALQLLPQAEIVDDVRAARLFEEAAGPLLRLEWAEFIEAEVDPEVPGLHAPVRFLDAAFRLCCKLRDARIAPERFMESALRGATQFYANPPNLATPDLLHYTKDSYRDSLAAGPAELQRQYRREVDLAKILAKLYRSYLDHPVRRGCVTPRDAVAAAADALEADPAAAERLRERYPFAFVDDAQELTIGELQFLQAVYGESLENVTLAGDRESATSTFRGARPDRVFAIPGGRDVLEEQRRSPAAVDAACRHLSGARGRPPISMDEGIGLRLFRATTRKAEAQFIADHAIELLNGGVPHDRIALLFRSVQRVRPYVDALLDRNVRVQVSGDVNVFAEPEALDALAVLWSLADPFRHEYLLRMLSGPAMALSDATLQVLCAEPPDGQALLFEAEDASQETRSGRWDPKRDLRLGWNVLRGDQDARLSETALERVRVFRDKRIAWLDAMRTHSLPALVRRVWSDGLARAGAPGSAREWYQQQTLARLHERVRIFARSHEDATLRDFLEDAEQRLQSAFEAFEPGEEAGAVRVLSIDAARGRDFDHVILPNARAGSFPRWYVPDAFLYSPSLGMIAKENVGDAIAARTAKFTYYMYRTKAREQYNTEERRAFVYAMRRARKSVLVTAFDRATRGVAAPEFLAELAAAQLPGCVDSSDRWRPAKTVYGT